ncbi:protein C-mannosyl-transferase DPY19L1-like [Styela clava]
MPRKQAAKTTEGNDIGIKKSHKSKSANKDAKSNRKEQKSASRNPSKGWNNWMIIAVIISLFVGWLHGTHISTMFEKDRHFSHLSSLERDLTFRTEMGLYYSYYKTVIQAPTLMEGVSMIVYDNITEFPSTINTLKRFNLYPELILGVAYRIFDSITKANKIRTMDCWTINRGELPPVQSCEGFGDQHYFYITNIFFLNGIMLSIYFMYGWYLAGESLWGGVLCVVALFFNHGECTRVMWTPPLRESYAMPFLILEMFLVTRMLKSPHPCKSQSIWIGLAAFSFMLPWQFAQFALLTQTAAVYALYLLEFIGSYKIKILLYAQIAALGGNFVFQFGNEMLLTSFYASSLVAILCIVLLESRIEKVVQNFFAKVIVKGLTWAIGTLVLKKAIAAALFIADDAHIWDILKSKFSTFNNFHTMLYTCAKEFDFIDLTTLFGLVKTLLIPANVLICVIVAAKCLRNEYEAYKAKKAADSDNTNEESSESTEEDTKPVKRIPPRRQKKMAAAAVAEEESQVAFRSKPHAEIVYNILQMFAFTLMAIMIMRLKLFMTPVMCIVTSILANRQILTVSRPKRDAFLVILLAMSCVQGFQNLAKQWNIIGEFENWPHEQLLDHINMHLPKEAVFAGAMPTMASIKLSCDRAIVNHPHYEDAGLRERTKKVYSMYSRRPLSVVHQTITDMGVTHFVLEDSWCVRKTRDGCQMPEIWDLEDVEFRGRKPACAVARKNPEPYFTEVFKNKVYTLLKVNEVKGKKN